MKSVSVSAVMMKRSAVGVALLLALIAGAPGSATAAVPDEQVVGWGDTTSSQATVPDAATSGVTAVAAGSFHSLALKQDGTVVAWGAGTGTALTGVNQGQSRPPAGLTQVTAIAGGGFSSLALKQDGSVVAWGSDSDGQSDVPVGLPPVAAIAAGLRHSLALTRDGAVVAWGADDYGQRDVPAALTATAIAAGSFHSLALKQDGTVVAWGRDDAGQTDVPPGLLDVTAVAAGTYYSLALKRDGTVVSWGAGPGPVPAEAVDVVAIAGGGQHALALTRSGSVVAWGSNTKGQTSIPATAQSGVTAIAAGERHSLALRFTPLAPGRPTISSVTAGDGQASVAFAAGAAGYPATPTTYTVTVTPTDGGSTTSASGSGSPVVVPGLTNGAAYRFTVTATNPTGTSPSSDPYGPVTIGTSPSISGTPPAATVGTAYSYSFVYDGAPTPTTAVSAGTLPGGLSLSTDGRLTGTPTTAGTSTFTVTATNAVGSASTTVTMTVAPKAAPKADLALTATAAANSGVKTITYTLTVTDKGPTAATRITTVALLPKGTVFQSAGGTPDRYGSRIVVWRAAGLDSGSTATYTVTVKAPQSGTKTLAGVTGSTQTPDPTLANNVVVLSTR